MYIYYTYIIHGIYICIYVRGGCSRPATREGGWCCPALANMVGDKEAAVGQPFGADRGGHGCPLFKLQICWNTRERERERENQRSFGGGYYGGGDTVAAGWLLLLRPAAVTVVVVDVVDG